MGLSGGTSLGLGSSAGPGTRTLMSQTRRGQEGLWRVSSPHQAVPKLPTQRNTETQRFIHLTAPVPDEEPVTLPRPWALLQAPGPPCYK